MGVSNKMQGLSRKLRRWFLLIAAVPALALAGDDTAPSTGQTLYLPIYSHLYHGNPDRDGKPQQTLVSAHISIRNTDPRLPIRVTSARYFDTHGKLLREFVPAPAAIAPLGTLELFVPRTDASGGSGANFVIVWDAAAPASPPLVEALHADIREARTLVFTTSARVIAKP